VKKIDEIENELADNPMKIQKQKRTRYKKSDLNDFFIYVMTYLYVRFDPLIMSTLECSFRHLLLENINKYLSVSNLGHFNISLK
jgi:hypothetical protein